jgi:uncharacterized protein involved in cysteine biosynthesis
MSLAMRILKLAGEMVRQLAVEISDWIGFMSEREPGIYFAILLILVVIGFMADAEE